MVQAMNQQILLQEILPITFLTAVQVTTFLVVELVTIPLVVELATIPSRVVWELIVSTTKT